MLEEQFNEINIKVVNLFNELYKESFKGSKSVFDATLYLYEAVGQLIETLEEKDENLDLEKTKLPNIDGLFEGHPVNEFVNAIIDFAAGNGKSEQIASAAKKLAAYQQGEENPVEKKETLDEFVSRVVDSLDLVDSMYAESFKHELKAAINTLEDRAGYAHFSVYTKTGLKAGKLNMSNETIFIVVDNKEFTFDKAVEEESVEEDCCENYDSSDYYTTGYQEPTSLYEYINLVDNEYAEEVKANLEAIEDHMDGTDVWGEEEYGLVRYYLKHLPNNSDYDIDMLSDRAVFLAWQQHKYIRTIK